MTKEEILAMEPGRELDALVAEKIMGWTDLNLATECIGGGCGVGIKPNETRNNAKGTTLKSAIPFYSTQISRAWEVFEHWGWQAQVGYSGEYFCDIMLGFDEEGNQIDGIVKDCTTAPEAICKAALLACLAVGA